MTVQQFFITAWLSLMLATGILWAGQFAWRKWRTRKLVISAKRINECKPGCFMIKDKETIE